MNEVKRLMRQRMKELKRAKLVVAYGVSEIDAFKLAIVALNETIAASVVGKLPYEYRSYLKTKYWKLRRALYIEHYGSRCQRCKKVKVKGLQLHHLRYDNLRSEAVEDLILVCRGCHCILEEKKEQ